MHNTRSDLAAIISVALGRIPHKDLAALTDRSYDRRKELQLELAEYIEESLLPHFEVRRRPMMHGGPPMSGQAKAVPDELKDFRPKGWRGRL
ncbi:hypothetical protein MPL1032_10286 [Mesorhizobium plurifarium]|uniref:Uncharacterized protein n=1 Tax=Mesorhizobium plurifarium TaxID=69974 RepID=A0A0K2VNI5_MESPL|nr:hypothetical protein MPL1032_10286 [Mesorhizobium plurifarium]